MSEQEMQVQVQEHDQIQVQVQDHEVVDQEFVSVNDLYKHYVQQPDGSLVLATGEQLQIQNDVGVDGVDEIGMDAHAQYVEEIIGGTVVDGNEVVTEQMHMDEEGNPLVAGNLHDLITLHAVDSQGNLITTTGAEDVGVNLVDHITMDGAQMDTMMETDSIVEEVIASTGHEEEAYLSTETMTLSSDVSQQYLNVQEAIFNPNTGTLQPVNSTPVSAPAVPSVPKSPKKVKPKAPQQMTKLIIAQQPTSDGTSQQQQLVFDANSLQNLIQGGGNISLGGGKNIILTQSKPKPAAKSPAKILPAPIPVGDQQQGGAGQPKFLLKQGNVLTPISTLNQGGARYIQVQGGADGQVQYVRVVPTNKAVVPSNKIPIAPATSKPKPVAPKPAPGQTIITLPAGTTAADFANLQNHSGLNNLVVLPNYVQIKSEPNVPIPIRPADSSGITIQGAADGTVLGLGQSIGSSGNYESFRSLLEPNGMRPRKPCNCTKSQCLKLYCDCFANGEFCHLCNCTNCFNNLDHEEDRQKAIKLVLERNPGAFRPKIGKSSQTGEAHERRHNKGCNCRRSGCLKNYCECYEAKIFCSGICKCTGCKNCIENIPTGLPNGVGVEQHFAGAGTSHRQTLKDLAEAAEVRVQQQNQVKNKMRAQMQDVSPQNNLGVMVPPLIFRYPHSSISYEVVTSTVELLLAKSEAAEKQRLSDEEAERMIMEEFGECLASVMELGNSIN